VEAVSSADVNASQQIISQIYHKQSFQTNLSNDFFNFSNGEQIISEEDPSLETDVPTI
jgi:hypothetical protein